jgi:hypothetical protein
MRSITCSAAAMPPRIPELGATAVQSAASDLAATAVARGFRGFVERTYGVISNRFRRNISMSRPVVPLTVSSARSSPTTLQNLKPWPEKPAATATWGHSTRRSIIKCSSGELVKRQVFIPIVGPSAEQHLAAAKLVRKNGALRAGAERELFIRKSNSSIVCVSLMAKDRGGVSLDDFDWWSLTPDWGEIDEQVRWLAPPHIDGPPLVPDLWSQE